MTRRRTKADAAKIDAMHRRVYFVQKKWRALHLDVVAALKGHRAKLDRDKSIGTCQSVDRAMRDCEHAGCADLIDGPLDFDRAEVLCRVVEIMLAREIEKLAADPRAWLMRHHPDLMPEPKTEKPRRRIECDEA
jgi:hypothetical protein